MRTHHNNPLVPSATFIIMMHHTFTVKIDVYYYDALDPGTTCNFYYYDDAFSCKGSRPLGATFSKRQLGQGGPGSPWGWSHQSQGRPTRPLAGGGRLVPGGGQPTLRSERSWPTRGAAALQMRPYFAAIQPGSLHPPPCRPSARGLLTKGGEP